MIGHGQMRERELERVMSDFYHQRYNVLVCSTIIETGIDVPTANTIIIERADNFGLAPASPVAWSSRAFSSSSLCVFADTSAEINDERCETSFRGIRKFR